MKKTLGLLFLMMLTTMLAAQDVTVTGRVTSESTGEAIPGVSIMVVGTTIGTITDIDGNYSLSTQMGETLRFSFIGYNNEEVTVTSSTINVLMIDSWTDLDEVVVIGYGVQKRALVTGANVNVQGDRISELNTTTAMEALQGVAAGVSVTRNSGAPGAGTRVTIRGLGTIGNSSPLYIVDGVAVGNIDYLNASDIESIDVLKDAASAAIYGSRAANGVILVTTKRGVRGSQPRVTYEGYYGVQNIYKNLTPLNAQEYMFIMNEGRTNDGLAPYDWETRIRNNSYLNANFPDQLGSQLGDYVWNKLQNGWEGTNWIHEMSKDNAPVQSHAINITGASDDVTYSLGFSYFDQTGILGGDITDAGYRRITARMNTEMIIFKNDRHNVLTVGENFTYTNTENRSIATGNIYWNDLHNALVTNPLMPAYWDQSPHSQGFTPTLEGVALGQHNPLAVMYHRHNYNWGKGNNITGNVYAIIEPIESLRIRSSFGVNAWFGHSRSWAPTYRLATQYSNTNDAATQEMYQGVNYTWTNTVNYDFAIDDHRIGLLVGSEVLENKLNFNVGGSKAKTIFGLPQYAYLDNVVAESISDIGTWGRDWAAQGGGLLSYMARASYNYQERYMLDMTFRADGSSNFAKGNRWGYFPSVSAGWNFTEENFFDGLGFMDFGKLRASWGQNGNQSIPNFIYSSNIAYRPQGYYFGPDKLVSSPTAVPENVPNPDVTWETSEQLNIGLDGHFLNMRLALTFDWYKKTTKDWLVQAPIQGTAGAGAPFINGGDIENKGFEISLGWNDRIGEFRYGAMVSGAYNENEVTRLANAEGIITGPPHVLSQGTAYISRVEVGKPIGFFYGFQTDGILQNQDEVDAYVGPNGRPFFEDQRPGDVRFVDQNGDGVIDENDKVMLGNPNPDFELGIRLNAEYKGFFANTTLTGKFGMQVMQSYRSFADQFTQNYTTDIFSRWHGEGTSDRIPRLSSSSHRNTNYISDIYLHDADYLRINNLTVGYRFDRFLRNVNWMEAASLYFSFNNLYTFTNYDGMDPEVGFGHDANWASGVDLGLYPLPRTVMVGVNVTF
ncbi:SusC/RagA family TonB-linked outer membrane protein [Natronoflexus pectinivorans]|uniref:TonB-linked SusC/RagA family outer membrane protein n=1 Tax=Natronoflexus pectinivorans TaxID=682526 RepID=A0A4R2GRM7_9BACT|nr:TonB-dependent receptor [Natronoflexus pectinivorans]TCO10806.1 TonB-linked SusC/RagA family outer membrane protein [Natronoflexus pectinivorans]